MRSLRLQGIESLESYTPLYDRKPPWWTRWTYFLVAADIITTVTACELTWNHWTQWEALPDEPESGDSAAKPTAQEKDAKEKKGHYVLRSWWQRVPFAGGQLFLGIALAALILGSRSRIVRRLYILPPASPSSSTSQTAVRAPILSAAPSGNGRIVLQGVDHWRTQGKVFPKTECTLERGKDESELILWINNVRGHHWFGMQDATINGKKLPVWQSREEIFKAWYGEEKGKKMSVEERWKSGPVLKSS